METNKPSDPWMPYSCIFGEIPAGITATLTKSTKSGPAPSSNPDELERILKENVPRINNHGKYLVRLFFMGKWRKVCVDDHIPVDSKGRSLLPMTNVGNSENSDVCIELWPILLTKALLKIHSLTDENIDGIPMFHPIENLTGHSPRVVQEDFWANLTEEYIVPEWCLNEESQIKNPNSKLVISHKNNQSFLLTQTRKCPLKEPVPDIEVPGWKLIRPTPEIQDLIKKQSDPPFEHKWFEFASSCFQQKDPEVLVQPSSNELTTVDMPNSMIGTNDVREFSATSSKGEKPELKGKKSRNSGKLKKEKLERTVSNLSAHSRGSLPVVPVTTGISMNSRKKWFDSNNIAGLEWVTVYENLSTPETVNQEYSSHTQENLELFLVFDSQEFSENHFTNLKINLSVLAKNIKEDSQNSDNIEAEFSIKEIFGMSNENILHVGACSGSAGHTLPLTNSKRHLLKFTLFGARHGYSLRFSLDIPKSHHNSINFFMSTDFEQISERFLNTRPYKFSKAAEDVYAEFIRRREIDDIIAADLEMEIPKISNENIGITVENGKGETEVKKVPSEIDFGDIVANFEETHGENHTTEFLERTIHRIEDSEKWTDGNEMYCYQVTGRFDSAQTEASDSWNLAYRDIFYASDQCDLEKLTWRLCVSDFSRDMAMKQSIYLIIVDNDTCEVKHRVRKVFRDASNFDIMTKPEHLAKNKFGYLVFVYAENNADGQLVSDCAFNWKIEIISNVGKQLIRSRELILSEKKSIESGGTTLFHAVDEKGDLMPTEGNVISRLALNLNPTVTNNMHMKPILVSIRATVSNPNTWIRLLLIERKIMDSGKVTDTTILETRGRGNILVPSKWLNPIFSQTVRTSRLNSSQTDRSALNDSNTSIRESAGKTRMRSPSPKTGSARKKSSKTKLRDDSAKSKTSIEQIKEITPAASTLSITRTPVSDDSENKGVQQRSYFVEIVYEDWKLNEKQRAYISYLQEQALQENKVFGENGEIVRSGSGEKKLKSQASKKVVDEAVVQIDESEKPKWSCSFIIDKELETEIEIKIDNTLQEWLKREKLSWACAEEKNDKSDSSVGVSRSEKAHQARQEWLTFRETDEAKTMPVIRKVGNQEGVELLTQFEIDELRRIMTETCTVWREERENLLEERETFNLNDTKKLARMKVLGDMFA